jgi:hypothetical protein
LFGGLAWLALGHLVDIGMVIWGGIAVVTGAFVLNTAGKVVHYVIYRLHRGINWR